VIEAATSAVDALKRIPSELGLADAQSVAERHAAAPGLIAPAALIELAIEAAKTHPALLGVVFDPERAAADRAVVQSLKQVVVASRAFAIRLEDEIRARRSRVGFGALALVEAVSSLARTPQGKPLRETLATMRRVLKEARKPRGPKKAKAPPVASPPAPEPVKEVAA
jgi:hypothetical protein